MHSAVLSITLTRLKPRGPPKAGAHVFLSVLNTIDMANVPYSLKIYSCSLKLPQMAMVEHVKSREVAGVSWV